jgi:hypothetical protein
MKRPRLRFTVRRLMIAVAILALSLRAILWVAEMRTRSAAHHRRAIEFVLITARSGSVVHTKDGRRVDRYENENRRREDAWARQLAEKYWHLSNYPWLAVEPDPPRPEPLAHPRSAFELPEEDARPWWDQGSDPPAWTFLWTWPQNRWW